MFDFTHRCHLALSDLSRRIGLKAVAGAISLVGAGFLVAAFWNVLSDVLRWGPIWASLTVAGLCLLVAGALLMVASQPPRHTMPTGADLGREVKARASLVTEAAVNNTKTRLAEAGSSIRQKLQNLWDQARYQGDRAAEQVDHGAEHLAEKLNATTPRQAAEATAEKLGINPQTISDGMDSVQSAFRDFSRMRVAPGLGLISAFAIGLALANAIVAHDDEDDYDRDDDIA